jgi:succinoglycan biosynthesis transport protein ExoP
MLRNRTSNQEESEEQAEPQRSPWRIILRRRWWILGCGMALGTAGVLTAQLWPALYRSEALVLIEHQRVPEQYVTPNVLPDLQYRLDSLTQQILSRTRLQQLIERFGLYQSERARLPMDMVIDEMREDIHIELVQTPGRNGQLTAFRISYLAANRHMAQTVTNELVSIFIDQSIRTRTQQSASTTDFLGSQLEQARQDLTTLERRLREYKLRYVGELPEQEKSNLQILLTLQSQLQVSGAALDRAEQQKVYLASMRNEQTAIQKALDRSKPESSSSAKMAALETRLGNQQHLLAERRTRYTAQHPDITALEHEIAVSEKELKELRAAEESRWAAGPAAAAPDRALADMESRLKAVDVAIIKGREEIEGILRRMQDVQKRLGLTPVREQELAEVTRNYENSRKHYESLLEKKLGSELATNLEKRQQGEQFRILDPASLPEKPSEPNRLQIVLAGWLLGFLGGAGLAALKEATDAAVRGESDVTGAAQGVRVLVRIPVLRDPAATKRLRFVRSMELAAAAAVLALCVASTTHAYIVG